jgi:hypothetical protein
MALGVVCEGSLATRRQARRDAQGAGEGAGRVGTVECTLTLLAALRTAAQCPPWPATGTDTPRHTARRDASVNTALSTCCMGHRRPHRAAVLALLCLVSTVLCDPAVKLCTAPAVGCVTFTTPTSTATSTLPSSRLRLRPRPRPAPPPHHCTVAASCACLMDACRVRRSRRCSACGAVCCVQQLVL